MTRQLPTIELNGLRYSVDVSEQVLRSVDNPDHEFSFTRDMQDRGSHYLLDLGGEVLEVPQLVELDPVGMAVLNDCQVEDIRWKNDFELLVDQVAYQLRLAGVLPKIEIAREEFTVDVRLGELRHAQHPDVRLLLQGFNDVKDGVFTQAFYHLAARRLEQIDLNLTELPVELVLLRIPSEVRLDPIGFARRYHIGEREMARLYPLQTKHQAELLPLTETGLPALIQRNKEQLRQEHEAKKLQRQKHGNHI